MFIGHAPQIKIIEKLVSNNSIPHAFVFSGPQGIGKRTFAHAFARWLNCEGEEKTFKDILNKSCKCESCSRYCFIYPDIIYREGTLEIEKVRVIKKQVNLSPQRGKYKVVIINEIEQMQVPAANAMLKILEEPALETVFILTTDSEHNLLPTIVSRAQKLTVYPVNLNKAHSDLGDRFKISAIDSAWKLSEGRIGLMLALLTDDSTHYLKNAIEQAKDFLRKDKYDRLLIINELGKDKKQLSIFLDAMSRLLKALHDSAVSKVNRTQAPKLLTSRRLVLELQQALDSNVTPRLILLKLAINLIG